MIDITNQLISLMEEFRERFGEGVPLSALPVSATTEELSNAIRMSIERGRNMLPEIFGC